MLGTGVFLRFVLSACFYKKKLSRISPWGGYSSLCARCTILAAHIVQVVTTYFLTNALYAIKNFLSVRLASNPNFTQASTFWREDANVDWHGIVVQNSISKYTMSQHWAHSLMQSSEHKKHRKKPLPGSRASSAVHLEVINQPISPLLIEHVSMQNPIVV